VTRSIDLRADWETAHRRLTEWAASSGLAVSERKLQYGISFTLETPRGRRSVVLYHSAKRPGSKLVFEAPELEMVEDLVGAMGAGTEPTRNSPSGTTVTAAAITGAHIGSDESGKGDYFGPMVVCAAYVGKDAERVLRSAGVRDSKELTDSEMRRMAPRIRETCGHVALVAIGPERYNQMHESMRRNINDVLAWAHGKAISDLIARLGTEGAFVPGMAVVIDQFAKDERVLSDRQREHGWDVQLVQMHRAESDVAVAAASILARVEFVDGLSRLSGAAGLELPKGAGRNVDAAGRELVRRHGQDALSIYTKRHFKNTDRVLQTPLMS
jgi:ribonuclease HIII